MIVDPASICIKGEGIAKDHRDLTDQGLSNPNIDLYRREPCLSRNARFRSSSRSAVRRGGGVMGDES